SFNFNTGVAALMEFLNFLSTNRDKAGAAGDLWRKAIHELIVVMSPMTPFICEELWHRMNFPGETVFTQQWPTWNEDDLILDTVEMVVQVKGKIRARITLPAGASKEEIEREALSDEKIMTILGGSEPRRIIVVPGKLINIIP
ncbi:MAG: class I tRNA ligase family protein, partial [Candidatus Fermentibacteraceae bacterium]|nr:class I tRNA ligase family protein [Candidatus Fermentibacteraceae bacterium]